MNNKIKTGIYALVFVLLLAGAYLAYHFLSDRYKPQNESSTSSSSLTASENSSAVSAVTSSDVSSTVSASKTSAPDFTVYDSAGNPVRLSDFKGKPVVLNFWASWCPPCKGEMPDFNNVYNTSVNEKDNVQFLMISLTDGEQETQKTASDFVKSKGFSFPIYFDLQQQAAEVYEITSLPSTLFIDKEGFIVKAYKGAIDKDTLTKFINAIK